MPPSGNETNSAQAYYRWLFEQYLDKIPVQSWNVQWSGAVLILLWSLVLIGFFGVFAWFFFSATRKPTSKYGGELYGSVSFNGYIYERMGRISWFSWLIWASVVIYAGYFALDHMINGQVY